MHVAENGESLVWPVLFLYPEYQTSDFIERFGETVRFREILATVFETPPEWDVKRRYRIDTITVYYTACDDDSRVEVNLDDTLQTVLSCRKLAVKNCLPIFYVEVASKNSWFGTRTDEAEPIL